MACLKVKLIHVWPACLRVKANSLLCLQYGWWIHGKCAKVKSVCPTFSRNFAYRNCEGNIGEVVEQKEKLCDEEETVREITYLGDRVRAGGGCEAVVTGRKDVGWLRLGSAVSCCIAGGFL